MAIGNQGALQASQPLSPREEMSRESLGLLLLAFLLLPFSLAGQKPLQEVSYGVRPGDEVEIRLFTAAGARLDEVSGTRIVDPNGEIYLPYVGSVRVAGMSAPELRQHLADAYSRLYSNPVVEVISRLKVNVTGAVRSPGHYMLDPSSSIIDAMARAGGVGPEVDVGYQAASDAANSRFVRNGQLFVLDLRPNTSDPSVFTLPIQSGDWIHIPIAERSKIREQVLFWGGVLSLVTGLVTLVIVAGG